MENSMPMRTAMIKVGKKNAGYKRPMLNSDDFIRKRKKGSAQESRPILNCTTMYLLMFEFPMILWRYNEPTASPAIKIVIMMPSIR